MRALLLCLLVCVLMSATEPLGGMLTIFHAGSLSVPLKEMLAVFGRSHPGLAFRCESAGSRDCARKLTDLGRSCDVLLSADQAVIDRMLIPGHATWSLGFATNEMVIAYRDQSRRMADITAANWPEILLDPQVIFGRSAPDSDPCGYRAVLTMKLEDRRRGTGGLADRLLAKDQRFIRPKSVDLLALLETGSLDYIFEYRSVAIQHGLKYLTLPDEVNLKSVACARLYASVTMTLSGTTPGSTMEQKGEAMIYGLTIPTRTMNPAAALAFVRFLLDAGQGLAILDKLGQPTSVPSPTSSFDALPAELKPFAMPLVP